MAHKLSILTFLSDGVLSADAQRFLNAQGFEAIRWDHAGPETLAQSTGLILIGSDAWQFQVCLEQLSYIRKHYPGTAVIALVANSSEETLLSALRAGVTDYLPVPFENGDLLVRIRAALGVARRSDQATTEGDHKAGLIGGERIVGSSDSLNGIRRYIQKVAETRSNVLITGETGTGKELTAELIHRNSARRNGPLVCVNCAAIPETLLEAELFGYDRGAFTGAYTSSKGKLASANGGTVFLDEIGDMSPLSQAKILRVIESKQVSPLGSRAPSPSDFRVIAATNGNLEDKVVKREFRRDLFFRLNVARIHLPPLRDRKEDILELLNQCVNEFNRATAAAVEGFTREALEILLRHDWPGNVRELRNVVEAMFVTCRKGRMLPADIPAHLWKSAAGADDPSSENARVLAALFETKWNVTRAAEKLHWSRMTLYRKMEKYSISKCHKA